MDVAAVNREAWDRQVAARNPWTVPVSADEVKAAREGSWSVVLTPKKPVPRPWFGELRGARILCLASGGGQQGPILAAAGARVTVLDNSPAQLAQDRMVADRDRLELAAELGVMTDLSRFRDGSFDLVFHPVANIFIPDLEPLWREAHRVLAPGGRLLSGITNPVIYLFDPADEARGQLVVRNRIPYSCLGSLGPEALLGRRLTGEPLEFGHTLEDQIGGQTSAGFRIEGFYEDHHNYPLDAFISTFIATLAVR
jgi:SAM-dependent methyltransferase